jgi:hypothetical protein
MILLGSISNQQEIDTDPQQMQGTNVNIRINHILK